MTNYKDFEINRKNGRSSSDERGFTDIKCLSEITSKISEYTIKECEFTAGSCGTGCCNSKKNCPGSTGRRK